MSLRQEQRIVLERLDLHAGLDVLDAACGPGLYSRLIAPRVAPGTVCGLDLSWPMLDLGVRQARNGGLANIVNVHGDAVHPPFADGHFNRVLCSSALHLIPDRGGLFRAVRRVLAPGGLFVGVIFVRGQGGWRSRLLQRIEARHADGFFLVSPDEVSSELSSAGLVDTVLDLHGPMAIVTAHTPA